VPSSGKIRSALRNNKNQKSKRRFELIYWRKLFCNFKKETIVMATKQQKYEALKTAIEIAKEYARSAAEGYPTGVMKDSYKAIIAIVDEIEKSDD
jgi:hypothetical protein